MAPSGAGTRRPSTSGRHPPNTPRRWLRRGGRRVSTSRYSPAKARCTVAGSPFMAGEFGFLGGSIGVAATERLVRAIERATGGRHSTAGVAGLGRHPDAGRHRRVPADGQAVRRRSPNTRAAGLPYLVYLRNPTTGGVLASWGSLGHFTVAEPGALIGFLGPAGLPGALRRAVPGRRADRREPLHARSSRCGDASRRNSGPSFTGCSTCYSPPGTATVITANPADPKAARRNRGGRLDARSPGPDGPTDQACAGCCGSPRPT